jgi:hypothetical protein
MINNKSGISPKLQTVAGQMFLQKYFLSKVSVTFGQACGSGRFFVVVAIG